MQQRLKLHAQIDDYIVLYKGGNIWDELIIALII